MRGVSYRTDDHLDAYDGLGVHAWCVPGESCMSLCGCCANRLLSCVFAVLHGVTRLPTGAFAVLSVACGCLMTLQPN